MFIWSTEFEVVCSDHLSAEAYYSYDLRISEEFPEPVEELV